MANILNNSDSGYHIGIMCLIYRVLRRATKPLTIGEVTELCAPTSLARNVNQVPKFRETLNFWLVDATEAHCLWNLNSDLTVNLLDQTAEVEPEPREIADIVRRALFVKRIPDITVKIRSKGNGDPANNIEPLLLQLAALLASGLHLPFNGAPYNQAGIGELTRRYLHSEHKLNSNELPRVIPWFSFLGFMESHNGETWVDPTMAVRQTITKILQPKQVMDIRKFMVELSQLLPVLDGGAYQLQAATVMASKGWDYDYHTTISPALSHALNRLQVANVIKFVSKSDDSNSIQLIHPQTKTTTSISQITYIGSEANA
jgi:hypothetical protein